MASLGQVTPDKSRRCAIYCRVSSEEQMQGYSIDAQLRACRAYATDKGWQVAAEYVDEGPSARTDSTAKRPKFKEMLEDALERQFDVLLVHKLDRFSRNRRITDECFQRLHVAGVGFISLTENMDFSTAWGQMVLGVLSSLNQFYSDNLSQETKKGKGERKAQGLYSGLLPFGVMKGEDGVPAPDDREFAVDGRTTTNHSGLEFALTASSNGATDRQVAQLLNKNGYRTTGNRGRNIFSKDTVRAMLANRFYLGYLPDGRGGWVKGKHSQIVDSALFESVQEARLRNRKCVRQVPAHKSVASLTGVAFCVYCKGRLHISETVKGRRRVECYNRSQGRDCPQTSAYLDVYETQIQQYLESFWVPEDVQGQVLDVFAKLGRNHDDTGQTQAALRARLERIKEMYEYGDLTREEYSAKRDEVQEELRGLRPAMEWREIMGRMADFMKNVAKGWAEADQELRHDLAKQLFEEVWIKDKEVVAVKPRPELDPMFDLQYVDDESSSIFGKWRKRRDSYPR